MEACNMTRAAIILALSCMPALSQVYVPQECAELALREGFPTDVMTKIQAAKAKLRLARLNDIDPIVRSCREAVARAKSAMH